jgi:cyclopropane-fatty-acyl-phospholipid synthase
VVEAAESAGFEVLDVENLRPHYAKTIGEWIKNMQRNEAECLKAVDRETYRTWLLYLAGTMIAFEDGDIDVHQTLLWKPGGAHERPFTREYVYRGTTAC